jgi:hypothetical protein
MATLSAEAVNLKLESRGWTAVEPSGARRGSSMGAALRAVVRAGAEHGSPRTGDGTEERVGSLRAGPEHGSLRTGDGAEDGVGSLRAWH